MFFSFILTVMGWLIVIFKFVTYVCILPYVCAQQGDTQAHRGDTQAQEICQGRLVELMNAYEKITGSWLPKYTDGHKLPPRLDSKEYIETMARYVSQSGSFYNTGKRVLIVGGPKDSGKTNGIIFLSRAAEDVGYHVINLNLKGLVDAKSALEMFSWQFIEDVYNMNDAQFSCVYVELLRCPAIERSWGMFFDKVVTLAMTIGVATISYLFQRKWYEILLLFLIVGTIAYCLNEYNPKILHHLSFTAFSIQERISNGDWPTIICSINAIANCHTMGPILFIRDVKNLQPKYLHMFFQSLHVLKEDKARQITQKAEFPIILETSDNLWMSEAHEDTSNSAFIFYYLSAMSYKAGKEEMVSRFNLFSNQTYDDLYSVFGGHVRFYKEFWSLHNIGNWTYNDSINFLIKEAEVILNVCLMKKQQQDVMPLLTQLNNSNFSVKMWYLTSRILLFYCKSFYWVYVV